MPEVIELSSSPPQALLRARSHRRISEGDRRDRSDDFDFNVDTFDSTGNIGFLVEQSSKRRRISPPQPRADPQSKSPARDDVLELSSDHESLVLPKLSKSATVGLETEVWNLEHSDLGLPTFSSSAPLPQLTKLCATKSLDLPGLDILVRDPIRTSSQTYPKTLPINTTRLVASRSDKAAGRPISRSSEIRDYAKSAKSRVAVKRSVKVDDNIVDSSQSPTKAHTLEADAVSNGGVKPAKKSKTEREAEKEAQKETKRIEKERIAADKQLAKDLAEVNKKKSDKKAAAPELILDIPRSLRGKSLGTQLESLLDELEVKTSYIDDTLVDLSQDNTTPYNIGHIFRWRRKTEAEYDEVEEVWKPLSKMKIVPERHCIVYLTAEEFCTIAASGPVPSNEPANDEPSEEQMKCNIDAWINLLRSVSPTTSLVILIQGLAAYLKKNANSKNRDYATAVRAQEQQLDPELVDMSTTIAPSSNPTQKRKRKPPQSGKLSQNLSHLAQSHIDILTLYLQLQYSPLKITHTTSLANTAHRITELTSHLATRPYRLAEQAYNLRHASFCMASGQIRTGGGDPRETWIRMLQELPRVTVSMAHGVVSEGYDSPMALIKEYWAIRDRSNITKQTVTATTSNSDGLGASLGRGYRPASTSENMSKAWEAEAKKMLEDVKKASNLGGAVSDRRLGPAVSRRIFRVFTGRDAGARDGIA